MQRLFLINYAKNMTKDDIYSFIKKNGISATEKEIDIVFKHIKRYYRVFFDNPIYYIKMLKGKISDENYYKILMLFDEYKNYLN
ncbi:MAG: hypothetical protein ACI31R_01035 [Bacilli bacterium]